MRTGAVIVTAALLLCGGARAQSSGGGGPFSIFDNVFTGSLSKGSQTATVRRSGREPWRRRKPRPPRAARRCPGAARTAPPAIP